VSQNPVEDAVDAIFAATAGNMRRALRVVVLENIRLRAELDAYRRVQLRKARARIPTLSRRRKVRRLSVVTNGPDSSALTFFGVADVVQVAVGCIKRLTMRLRPLEVICGIGGQLFHAQLLYELDLPERPQELF